MEQCSSHLGRVYTPHLTQSLISLTNKQELSQLDKVALDHQVDSINHIRLFWIVTIATVGQTVVV